MSLAEIKEAYLDWRNEYCKIYMRPMSVRFQDDPAGTRVRLFVSTRTSKSRPGLPTGVERDLGVFAPEEKRAFFEWVQTVLPRNR